MANEILNFCVQSQLLGFKNFCWVTKIVILASSTGNFSENVLSLLILVFLCFFFHQQNTDFCDFNIIIFIYFNFHNKTSNIKLKSNVSLIIFKDTLSEPLISIVLLPIL